LKTSASKLYTKLSFCLAEGKFHVQCKVQQFSAVYEGNRCYWENGTE
jgi:hypothetical protein